MAKACGVIAVLAIITIGFKRGSEVWTKITNIIYLQTTGVLFMIDDIIFVLILTTRIIIIATQKFFVLFILKKIIIMHKNLTKSVNRLIIVCIVVYYENISYSVL